MRLACKNLMLDLKAPPSKSAYHRELIVNFVLGARGGYLDIRKDADLNVSVGVNGNITAIEGRTITFVEMDADLALKTTGTGSVTGISATRMDIEDLSGSISVNAKGSGTAGSTFLKPLVGSLKAVKDPLAATLENDLRIVEFAQRNHWTCQLAETAKALELEGFAVMEDRGGGGRLHGSNRYGSVTYLKDGKRMTLVMPKVVAEGFAAAAKDMNLLIRANRWISGILTQYSPRFALRNIVRNRESNNNNIAWMREGAVVTAAGVAGMRPVARWANFLMEQAAAHLPDKVARNALMNVLYGETTNMYWVAQATRMAFTP